MTRVKDIIAELDKWAPTALQESYDNGGLIVGNPNWEVKGVLCCLDSVEAIIDEAISLNCNVVLAHHPIVFSGLKKLTGKSYVEQTIMKAIKHDIAIVAWHTALDSIGTGVNYKLGNLLGVKKQRILQPKRNVLYRLGVYVPKENLRQLEEAVFAVGGGYIGNYSSCSFYTEGMGSFKPETGANPHTGELGVRSTVSELKVEFVVPEHARFGVHQAMLAAHPFEEVAHEWVKLDNYRTDVGSGMIGEFEEPIDVKAWMNEIKGKLQIGCIKHTMLLKEKIQRIAWCGGSGDFLLEDAIAQGAEVFVTSDFKYHRFFDHQGKIVILDIGHYETESCVIDLLSDWLTEKFTTFAIHKTRIVTNPVQYF